MNPTTNGAPTRTNPFGMPTRVIVFGYYDGPTDGVIQFASGDVYRFVMLDEEEQLSRQSFPRDYMFHLLPPDALDRLEAVLGEQLTPQRPSWYINWQFESPEVEQDIDARVAAILAEAAPATWHVTLPSWDVKDFHPLHVVSLQAV